MLKPFVFIAFHLYLKRKIEQNYFRRSVCAILRTHGVPSPFPEGDYPDKWYWADKLCSRYGFFVESQPGRDQHIARFVQTII